MHQNYLKGQYYRLRYTAESLAKVKEFFERALAIDPNYASAYSGLAGYYNVLASLGMKSVSDVAPLAKSAAKRALAIDLWTQFLIPIQKVAGKNAKFLPEP